jgi:hypothetical protein
MTPVHDLRLARTPSESIWGAETAAPVFAEMAEKTVILLDIPPDYIRQQLVAK